MMLSSETKLFGYTGFIYEIEFKGIDLGADYEAVRAAEGT
jgi:hypothetical protein